MFNIIYLPSGTIVSQHATQQDADLALLVAETNPPSHEIVEVTDGNN